MASVAAGDPDRLTDLLAGRPALARARWSGHTVADLVVVVATADPDDEANPAGGASGDPHPAPDRQPHQRASPSGPAAFVRCLEVACAAGAPVDEPGPDGWTPLHRAACAGRTDLVEVLLDAGADPATTVGARAGANPMSFALFYGHSATAAAIDTVGRHPDDLRSAAGLGDTDAVRRCFDGRGRLRPGARAGMAFCAPLAAFGERPGPVDDTLTINEALTWAARNGQIGTAGLLVERGADVNANPFRGTPLLWATFADDAPMIRWLVEHGADPNLRHDFGGLEHGRAATALHLAAQYACRAALDALLEAGADPTIADAAFGATPAGWAAHAGHREVAARLRALEC